MEDGSGRVVVARMLRRTSESLIPLLKRINLIKTGSIATSLIQDGERKNSNDGRS